MKRFITSVFKEVGSDRRLLVVLILLAVFTAMFVVYVGLKLSPVESQVAVRYTAYGNTHLYRDRWYYLISFIAFAFISLIIHTVIIVKLHRREMYQIALYFGSFSLLMLLILFLITNAVLGNAYFL